MDWSQIRAEEDQQGPMVAVCMLLQRVACKDKDWFAKLMWTLCQEDVGQKELVADILCNEAGQGIYGCMSLLCA